MGARSPRICTAATLNMRPRGYHSSYIAHGRRQNDARTAAQILSGRLFDESATAGALVLVVEDEIADPMAVPHRAWLARPEPHEHRPVHRALEERQRHDDERLGW